MSHHFDTKLAKQDPSLNVCDFYLFDSAPGRTVMALTVNPDVGLSASDVLHNEGLYAFRFDQNGQAIEDVSFKFTFGPASHSGGDEHRHIQDFRVTRAAGIEAKLPDAGSTIIDGKTGKLAAIDDIKAFVGTVADPFSGNGDGLHAFMAAYQNNKFDGDAFNKPMNSFANRNITAVVLEVPNQLLGGGKVQAWATASLFGHAPEMQVSRWGLPMVTHIFLKNRGDSSLIEQFNATVPSQDTQLFFGPISKFVQEMSTFAAFAPNPAEYGQQVAKRLCPTTLPYEIGTTAAFELDRFNGRPLGDDAMDVMLSLACNKPLKDGAVPDRARIRLEFPYFGSPYTPEEQKGVTPVRHSAAK